MTPIGKGSRFRALTGESRGDEGVIADGPDDRGRFLLTNERTRWEATSGLLLTADDLESARFQRLADAPAEVDPLFAEIAAKIAALRIEPGEGAGNALDMIAAVANNVDRGYDEEGTIAIARAALLECAAYAIAGLREIDAGGTS